MFVVVVVLRLPPVTNLLILHCDLETTLIN